MPADEIVRPRVPLKDCLDCFSSPEEIHDFYSSALKTRTTATKTAGLTSFPDYLVLHMRKFVMEEGWVPKKLDIYIDVPDTIDISDMRSRGLQPGEELLPEGVYLYFDRAPTCLSAQGHPNQKSGPGDTNIISSYLDGVPVPVPVGDTDIISSYLDGVPVPVPVPVGDTDIISSYLDGVPVPVPAGDTDMSSYLVDVPRETLVVLGETSAHADRDQDHHMRPGVAVETFPEPGSSSFMDFIFNMEDVTRLIDFDF